MVDDTERQLFGMKLKMIRKNRKHTQEYCIHIVGCNVRTWYRWEQGLTHPIPIYKNKIIKMFPELG